MRDEKKVAILFGSVFAEEEREVGANFYEEVMSVGFSMLFLLSTYNYNKRTSIHSVRPPSDADR
jgi:hypothetical protein